MSETPWPARGCELYGHKWLGKHPCACGTPYVELTDIERRIAGAVKYSLPDVAGRDQSAEDLARRVSRALGLTPESSREEWELTGQPDGTLAGKPFPPYRFVFGNPNEGNQNGTPESRARGFIALCNVHRWSNVRLRRRVIVEHPWEDQNPFEECPHCHHSRHAGVCGHLITETKRDDVGYGGVPPSGQTRTMLVDTCGCETP